MKTNKMSVMIAAAAMGGLIAGSASRASAAPAGSGDSRVTAKKVLGDQAGTKARTLADDDSKGKHDCKGKNDCKGHGGCKTGDNGCKGKNSCKGKGGCNTKEEKKDKTL